MPSKSQMLSKSVIVTAVSVVLVMACVGAVVAWTGTTIGVSAPVPASPTTSPDPVASTTPVPPEMKALLDQGLTMAEAAEVLSPPLPIGTRIDLGDGQYAVRIDDQPPEGLKLDPILVAAGPEGGSPFDYLPPPPHLVKSEWMLYGELRAAGKEFELVQGEDRYLHIRQ